MRLTGHCLREEHLPTQCSECEPLLGEINILGKSSTEVDRELLETFINKEKGDDCISAPLNNLYNTEGNRSEVNTQRLMGCARSAPASGSTTLLFVCCVGPWVSVQCSCISVTRFLHGNPTLMLRLSSTR